MSAVGSDARWRRLTWALLTLHALTLVALCWQLKLTPDEANYVRAGSILRRELRWEAYNTMLHGPLAFYPNQLGALCADPSDFASYVPWGRLGFVPFTLLAALALLKLARAALGARGVFASLLLWTTCPLVLAHGCLMTADMALTCGSLWTLERTWAWLRAPSLGRLLGVGVVLGLTLATKYLGLFLVPILALALGVALLRGFAPRVLWSRHRTTTLRRLGDAGLAAVLVAASAGVALHSSYLWQPGGYRVAADNPPTSGAVRRLTELPGGAPLLRLLPAPWVRGIDYQMAVSEGLPTFFGDRVAPGFWSYYLVAFGTKLPLLALLLAVLGLIVRTPPWPRDLGMLTLLASAVPIVFLSGITTLQIGVRYALPVVPWLCLLGGRGLAALGGRARWLAAAVAVALVADAATTWPRYLTAFNGLAPRPYLWFMDSTLDWRVPAAQEPEVLELAARHPDAERITGAAGPRFGKLLVHGEQLAPRDPRDPGRIYHWLRRYTPIDRAGAWFVFDLDEAGFRAALPNARSRAELASALLRGGNLDAAEGNLDAAEQELRDNTDADAPRAREALALLRTGDPTARAQAFASLGHHDLVLALGASAPRVLRGQALLLTGDPGATVELLRGAADRTPPETYLLAAALESMGQLAEALGVVEAAEVPAGAEAIHRQALERLRHALAAQQLVEREERR